MKRKHIIIFDEPEMPYMKGYKYQLPFDLNVFIPSLKQFRNFTSQYVELKDGHLTVRAGWAWDGATNAIDTKSSIRSACIHDALYWAIRHGLLPGSAKEVADELLHDICLIDGMWHWRADGWRVAVGHLAHAAADPKNKKKVLVAGKGLGDVDYIKTKSDL